MEDRKRRWRDRSSWGMKMRHEDLDNRPALN